MKTTITLSSLDSWDIPSNKEARVSKRYDIFSRLMVGIPKTNDTESRDMSNTVSNVDYMKVD